MTPPTSEREAPELAALAHPAEREAPLTTRRRDGLRTWGLRLISIAVVLFTWWLLTALHIWKPLILPSPAKVWGAFEQSVTSSGRRRGLSGHYLWEHLGASLERIARGMFWAILVGPPIGLMLASVRPIRIVVEPWITFLRSLPPLGYFPLLILWFGIYDTSKVWLLFLAAFPPIALATFAGVERVRVDRVDAAKSLGAS